MRVVVALLNLLDRRASVESMRAEQMELLMNDQDALIVALERATR